MNDEEMFAEPMPTVEPQPHLQELVLRAALRLDGLSADEAGQVVHAVEGKHGADETCEWCPWAGGKVLRSLEAKGLVSCRGGHWSAV